MNFKPSDSDITCDLGVKMFYTCVFDLCLEQSSDSCGKQEATK